MSYGDLQGDARAVAEPENVRLVDLQVPKEGRDIVGGGLERDGRIAIGRAAMRLLLQRDDPAAAALSTTMHFVVHVNSGDRCLTALEWFRFES